MELLFPETSLGFLKCSPKIKDKRYCPRLSIPKYLHACKYLGYFEAQTLKSINKQCMSLCGGNPKSFSCSKTWNVMLPQLLHGKAVCKHIKVFFCLFCVLTDERASWLYAAFLLRLESLNMDQPFWQLVLGIRYLLWAIISVPVLWNVNLPCYNVCVITLRPGFWAK